MNTTTHHPRLWIALNTRTRMFGTLNLAVALRGKSTGWGKRMGRPRRTFIGHHRVNPNGGHHYVRLLVRRGPTGALAWERTLWEAAR